MKKVFSIILSAVLLCVTLSLASCQKADSGKDVPGGDGLAGTSWSGTVSYSYKDGNGGGAISGQLTISFESGNKCYNGFWEETVSYSQSGSTIDMKWSKNNGSMKLVRSGNTMSVSGSDDQYSYSGSISRK